MMSKVVAAAALNVAIAGSAFGSVGEGYVQIPGISGGWQGGSHKDWIRIEGRYWGLDSYARLRGTGALRARAFFSGPSGPRRGAGELVISVQKQSPALAPLMEQCAKQARIPEVIFAESSEGYRDAALQLGDRPAVIPPFFEYKLEDVQLSECPVATDAPEQAFVLKFGDIEWLNFHVEDRALSSLGMPAGQAVSGVDVTLEPAKLLPAQSSGKTKSFIVSWLGFAHDVSSGQCPMMNSKPKAEDFGLSSEQIVGKQQGGGLHNPLERRGPGNLNVCLLPGIAHDPGNAAPQTSVARGLDLDGDDGTGVPPAGTCKHKNYVSEDGHTGIDNQFYTVAACIAGLQGKKGLWQQVLNEEWRSGANSLLIQISGIDDEQNDDSIDVTILYSQDPAAKDASGKEILPDYTFRLATAPEFTHFFRRLHARIINGVIVTDKVQELDFNLVKGPTLRLANAQMRLEFTPDGNLKGVLGGYQDWRYLVNYYSFTGFEVTFGFQCPAFYNALKRAADGMRDPVTGECYGISVAYDIEAIPAFIPPSQLKRLVGQTRKHETRAW
jgi:hypothetical protein